MILGVGVGFFYNTSGNQDSTLYDLILLLGDIFIRLLKMVIVPLIFTSILTGITSISNFNQLGRIIFKTILYYLLTSLFAIIIGLGLTNTLKPGDSYTHSETTKLYDYTNLNTPDSTLDIFIPRLHPPA